MWQAANNEHAGRKAGHNTVRAPYTCLCRIKAMRGDEGRHFSSYLLNLLEFVGHEFACLVLSWWCCLGMLWNSERVGRGDIFRGLCLLLAYSSAACFLATEQALVTCFCHQGLSRSLWLLRQDRLCPLNKPSIPSVTTWSQPLGKELGTLGRPGSYIHR